MSTPGGIEKPVSTTTKSSSQTSDKCSKHDVVFAICTSGFIPGDLESEERLNALKSFLSSVVAGLKVASKTDQVALVTFEDNAHVEFYLNSYSDPTLLAEAISEVGCRDCSGGQVSVASALDAIKTEILTNFNGYRPEVSQMIIVVTDRWWDFDLPKTDLLFSQLRNAGAYTIPVGVTDAFDEGDLQLYATPTLKGKSQELLKANNFASLNKLVPKVLKTIETIAC